VFYGSLSNVVSTGSTLKGLRNLMEKAGAAIVAEAAIFIEGDPKKWERAISLGSLPVFTN